MLKHITIIRQVALVALASVFVLGAAIPAEAATRARCVGASCAGKAPMATGCNRDARTVSANSDGEVRVELRYSARCKAYWSRVTRIDRATRGMPIYAQMGSGAVTWRETTGNTVWSYMWTARLPARGGLSGITTVSTR
jgi:Protein of unknown function (DUF2690)